MFKAIQLLGKRDLFLLIMSTVISLVVILYMIFIPFDAQMYAAYGYIGVGAANLLASAPPISLMPASLVTFVAARKLDYLLLILISTIAASLGELVVYYLGDSVDKLVKHTRWHQYLKTWFYKAPFLFLVVWVALPNPIQSVGQVFAGTTHYPVWKYFLAVLCGNLIWFTMVVHFGEWLFQLLPI